MFLAGHVPHRLEPCPKRLASAFEYRPGRGRGLALTRGRTGTARGPCAKRTLGRNAGHRKPSAQRTRLQVLNASRFGREPLDRIPGAFAGNPRRPTGCLWPFVNHALILHVVTTRGKWIARIWKNHRTCFCEELELFRLLKSEPYLLKLGGDRCNETSICGVGSCRSWI